MWFKTKQGIEYKVNDEFIGVKMTREEAKIKVVTKGLVDALEALGLIKFDAPEQVRRLCGAECDGKYNFRIEQWPEGFVLWYNGVIVWRSWRSWKCD